jgi:two-component system response regulator YesN
MKLMIADDEKWVRTTIKTLIPFDELDVTLVCEAANGIEALELCRRYNPDVLLTDIMMPGLTGLDLIKELRSCSPNIKIAIISGYNDFDYAKTAMKYGINDYLLKPVDEVELRQVIERFKRDIGREAMQNRVKEQEKEQYRLAVPVMSEAFLNQALSHDTMTADKIRLELSKYGISFTRQYFSIATFSPDDPRGLAEGDKAEHFRRIVKRVMKRFLGAVTFPLSGSETDMVAIINSDTTDNADVSRAFRLCSLISEKRLGITISAGMSSQVRQLGMLRQLGLQSSRAMEKRFWEGPGKLHFYTPNGFKDEFPLHLTEEALNKITLNMKLSNIQTALSYIDGICGELDRSRDVEPELVREFFWQVVQSVISMLNIQMPFIRHEALITGEQPYERIKGTLFMKQLGDFTKDIMQRIFDFFHDKNPINNTNLIENAKKVIESNYAGDISLEQVARHVHLSPAYLSELFKKETGMSFIDYKTIVRIENAKRLIVSTPLNIYDVSARVGYSDPKYFSKLFKKITGKTVFEYKKEAKQ